MGNFQDAAIGMIRANSGKICEIHTRQRKSSEVKKSLTPSGSLLCCKWLNVADSDSIGVLLILEEKGRIY